MYTVNPFYATWYNATLLRTMRLASPIVGFLTLVLLVALPVGGNPALSVGDKTSYNVSATISIPPTVPCSGSSYSLTGLSLTCMELALLPSSINVTGTLGWRVSRLTSTNAILNVTHDLTVSNYDMMAPSFHNVGSFNESVNLASRIINIMPFLGTDMDATLLSVENSMSTSLPAGMDPSLTLSALENGVGRSHFFTMWWMNETLHQGENIPVLVFNTTVTGSTKVNLGGALGTRDAWTLVFNLTRVFPDPTMSTVATTYPTWVDHDFGFVLTFNYDQKSGLLLSATANLHTGFELIESPQCNTSTLTKMPSGPCSVPNAVIAPIASCGFNIRASLTLASTNLNLDQSMTAGNPSTGGENSGNSGTQANGGSTGSGNSGSSSGGTGGSSSGSNSGSGSPSGSQSSAQPAPRSSSTGLLLYLILGAIAVAIVLVSLLFVRKRSRRNGPQTSPNP